ncbi:TetR family transcriptional regulator [Enterococcus florum]|uniref:TetR family transcriptional regulator n=1 Tax=Enterococcus florum TaxID=2480627 RepID=A0A4V0WPC8_9ENTE|nr:TetR/AcrR family transcriptional regulator [Enterococcus florum]GCF93409.1 TetR family transcriptional regulator [Enterococcus florum]
MPKKMDLRVKRTHKMIVEAFVSLVETKGYDNITVQEIADQAMINRATFYAHFKDKQDLYDFIFHNAIEAFASVLDPDQIVQGNRLKVKQVELVLTSIYQRIQENRKFFLTIMDASANEMLRKQIADILDEKYAHIFRRLKITENDIEVPMDFILEYMTSIFVGTLHWWITSGTTMDANSLATLVIKLVGNGHLTILGIEIER